MNTWNRHWKTRLIISILLIAIDYIYGLVNSGQNKYPMHYIYLGLIDAGVLFILPVLFGKSPLVRDLQRLNYLAVIAHFYGFCIYTLYLPPITYNSIIYFLALLQYVRLLWINKNDKYNRRRGDYFWSDDIRYSCIDLSELLNKRENK